MYEQLGFPGLPAPLAPNGYVYIGARGGYVKIGYSQADPLGRCVRLQLRPLVVIPGCLKGECAG